jgi:hypothetical protein
MQTASPGSSPGCLSTSQRCRSLGRWRKRSLTPCAQQSPQPRYERNERYEESPRVTRDQAVRGHPETPFTDLDDALADAAAARIVIADTETEMAVIEASITLGTSGPNETARKAAVTLALREDAGDQSFATAVREARVSLYSAERRQVVAKQRIYLLRAALALVDVPNADQ